MTITELFCMGLSEEFAIQMHSARNTDVHIRCWAPVIGKEIGNTSFLQCTHCSYSVVGYSSICSLSSSLRIKYECRRRKDNMHATVLLKVRDLKYRSCRSGLRSQCNSNPVTVLIWLINTSSHFQNWGKLLKWKASHLWNAIHWRLANPSKLHSANLLYSYYLRFTI